MVTGNRDPLDRRARDALDAEKAAVVAPAGASARVLSRLRVSTQAPEPHAPPRGSGAAAGALARTGALALALAAGAGAGWVARGATIPPAPPRIVYVDRPAEPAAAADPDAFVGPLLTSASEARPAASSPPARTVAAAPAPLANAGGGTLGDERALLDVAHTALARGDGSGALAAVARHEGRYPSGALSEEREAIAVQALVLLGRSAQARSRGARFRDRFPTSLSGPAVDAALASIGR